MAYQFLSDEQIAEHFVQANAIKPGEDVLDLEPRVAAWLDRVNLGHRRAFPVAIQAAKLTAAHVPSAEEAARLDDLHQGIGDSRPPLTEAELVARDRALAARVSNMSMAEYARERTTALGMHRSLLDFLGGSL
jgi:hypothetical protein